MRWTHCKRKRVRLDGHARTLEWDWKARASATCSLVSCLTDWARPTTGSHDSFFVALAVTFSSERDGGGRFESRCSGEVSSPGNLTTACLWPHGAALPTSIVEGSAAKTLSMSLRLSCTTRLVRAHHDMWLRAPDKVVGHFHDSRTSSEVVLGQNEAEKTRICCALQCSRTAPPQVSRGWSTADGIEVRWRTGTPTTQRTNTQESWAGEHCGHKAPHAVAGRDSTLCTQQHAVWPP